ncbi:ethanolamine ammonia-lyase subunit EutC [Rhodococcus coprophilus]|uniref:Ethanolamine ammonia-lyase small subunit n=1 Tax=Rhodococcus coprophilus TaxID=38310 RepID=A0A2X4U8L4_9NOCA|nr:ethanolamine ammonia-lyase subunit EutC [Rhodococcus coprophilus]MBM7461228.1 ethanolamine ammonia-lyase small subunit [Rhodococcus coprophilus]SQI29080.1 ethanolamine ammonia lyase light chain eutc [Rhodococcus coprophilus]
MTDAWDELRRHTRARIGLGRAGNGLPTRRHLEFVAAQAAARDAVHAPLDVASLADRLRALRLGEPLTVRSAAADRDVYLRRPDLGRRPEEGTTLPHSGADIGIALCDGLSSTALLAHGPDLTAAIVRALPGLTFAPPVIATQARVALGDHIGAQLGVTTMLVLIGERPGLSVADSVGVYLTHHPEPGRRDSERNCVSNIHPPHGMSCDHAARVVAALVDGARKLGASGVVLKDDSRAPSLTEVDRPAL